MLAEDDRKTLEHGAVPIPEGVATHAHVGAAKYREMYAASVADAETFWAKQGERLDWMTPYGRAKNTSFSWPDVSIRWFEEGTLNVSANCVDRHLAERGDQTAILWEPDDPAEAARHISYRELHAEVGRMANVLKGLGVGKGDRVVIYLPMIPEAAFAMLACSRIGAIHSIVFAGFSPDALANRINDCDARVVITSDEAPRGGRVTALKTNVNKALLHCPHDVQVSRRPAHRRPGRLGSRPRPLAARVGGGRLFRLRAGTDGQPRTRCSSSTPRAQPASQRAWCTRAAAISCSPR